MAACASSRTRGAARAGTAVLKGDRICGNERDRKDSSDCPKDSSNPRFFCGTPLTNGNGRFRIGTRRSSMTSVCANLCAASKLGPGICAKIRTYGGSNEWLHRKSFILRSSPVSTLWRSNHLTSQSPKIVWGQNRYLTISRRLVSHQSSNNYCLTSPTHFKTTSEPYERGSLLLSWIPSHVVVAR